MLNIKGGYDMYKGGMIGIKGKGMLDIKGEYVRYKGEIC